MDERKVIDRDASDTRFDLLFTNSRPRMPIGYEAPLPTKSIRQRIRERLETIAASTGA